MSGYISAADIGRLAGFGASAISNWRRRHTDFPTPRGRAANGSALFARDEVVEYLGRHGRLPSQAADGTEAWPGALLRIGAADAVISVAGALIALAAAAPVGGHRSGLEDITDDLVAARIIDLTLQIARTVSDGETVFEPLLRGRGANARRPRAAAGAVDRPHEELITPTWRLIENQLDQTAPDPAAPKERTAALQGLFERLLELRMRERSGRVVETRTEGWVSRLMVELADARRGTVFDPAAGEAGFLLDAARTSGTEAVTLAGREHDSETWRFARQRLLVHGVGADVRLGDSLAPGGPGADADAVVCDPPFGLRVSPERWPPTDERWKFGIPAPNADLAWVQLAIHHLRDGGRAAVLLPAASLYQSGFEARIRVELLHARAIEAIIVLPPGTRVSSQHAVAVWLLRRPEDATTDEVLLVDATDADVPVLAYPGDRAVGSKELAVADQLSRSVLSTVHQWRAPDGTRQLDPEHSVAVPAAQLIAANAELLPARWTSTAAKSRPASEIAGAISEIKELRRGRPLPKLELSEVAIARPDRRRVRQLVADGALELIAGARIASSSGAPAGAVRAWGPWDFRDEPARFTQTAGPITRPGDIIVLQSLGGVRARIDEDGGCAIAPPAQALRIRRDSETGAQLDPLVCAAFLEDAENTRVATGGSAGRIGINELELPVLDRESSRRLNAALAALQAQKDSADELSRLAIALRGLLLSAVGSGAVELR